MVRVGAAAAALGALLALIAGVGRTSLTMAREHDLREAIDFSSFGVLVYYLVANLAAFTQDRTPCRSPPS